MAAIAHIDDPSYETELAGPEVAMAVEEVPIP